MGLIVFSRTPASVSLPKVLQGTQFPNRRVRMIGVGLMDVDIAQTHAFARIASFLRVGAKLLVVGYFFPVLLGSESTDCDQATRLSIPILGIQN